MATDIHRVIALDPHPEGMTYIAWLKSGHRYGTYDTWDNVVGVSIDMLINALRKSTTVQEVDISETPFSEWTIPDNTIKIKVFGHADIYALPVTKNTILTIPDDPSLGHGTTTPEELRETLERNEFEHALVDDSPFRRKSGTNTVKRDT